MTTTSALGGIILLGAPGSGKGTQSRHLVEAFNLYHIDTGKCLRAEITQGSEAGRKAQSFMDKGELVPFPVVLEVIKAAMLRSNTGSYRGFLFDGFPRNREQAAGLETILSDLNLKVSATLYMEIDSALLHDRLVYRVNCGVCGTNFNTKLNPPKATGVCDNCGNTELITRADDNPDVMIRRLQAYQDETTPLIAYYEEQGLLHRIDADRPVETVFANIRTIVESISAVETVKETGDSPSLHC